MSSIFSELKRRNVFRVAALYAAVSWALLQITDVLAPAITLPEWVTGFVALLLLIGFPVAVIFAWAFELTPEGVKRTESVDESQSIATNTGRRLDGILIAALVVFGAIVLSDRFLPGATTSDDQTRLLAMRLPANRPLRSYRLWICPRMVIRNTLPTVLLKSC